MQSSELIMSGRLEELIGGALAETESEARAQALARELRAASMPASAALRTRVEDLVGTPSRPRFGRPAKLVVVLAAVAALVAAVATVDTTSNGGGVDNGSAGVTHGSASGEALTERGVPPAITKNLSGDRVRSSDPQLSVFGPSGRAQDVDMWITLRVKDADQLSESSQEAMKITRELGGVVGSSNVATEGTRGKAELRLKIPTSRIDDALFRLSELGTVTGQRVATVDLQAPLDRAVARVDHLGSAIRIAKARLASGLLSTQEELQMRIQLEHLRSKLRSATRTRAGLEREASMAELTLALETPTGAVPQTTEGGIAGAVDKAVDVLRGAGSVAVFLGLVLSPLLVLALLAWLALRARGRRIERELLDESRPGVASPQRR
jgi:Domain of unknown function (DUF4349)